MIKQINVSLVDNNGNLKNISINSTDNILQLKNHASRIFNIPANNFKLLFNNKLLNNKFQNLIQCGIKNNDIVIVRGNTPIIHRANNNPTFMQNQVNTIRKEAEALRAQYYNNGPQLNMLLERDPEMAQAILSDNINDTITFITERKKKIFQKKQQQMLEERKLMSNPFDVSAQKEIEKRIKMERMNKNLMYAHENMPESFINTTMLYIPMEVNGKHFQAFIDSGAQSTIMSKQFVERCGLMKDVDIRYKGVALGVGTTKIIGRIHVCKLKVAGGHLIECAIQVLEQNGMNMLFGLDMLKKHRCCINLLENSLEFKSAGFSVPFVADHKINESLIKSQLFFTTIQELNLEEKEARIETLTQKGVSRVEAIALLTKYNWNNCLI